MSPENKNSTPDFSFLGEMKGVKDAFMGKVKEKFEFSGLAGFDQAELDVKKGIVSAALTEARKGYVEREYGDKIKQVDAIETALEDGSLSFSQFVQGLGVRAKDRAKQSPLEKVKGLFAGR